MSNGLNVGDAFLLSTPPKGKHLFIVIALTQDGKYLCVNVTSKHHNSDTSCILQQGDHPFIKHDSVICYQKAREVDPTVIQNCKQHQPVSPTLLNRIQQCGLKSTRLKNGCKETINQHLFKQSVKY